MRKRKILLPFFALLFLLASCGQKEASAPAATLAATAPTVAEETVETQPEKTVISAVVARHSDKTPAWWADFEKKYETANPQIDLEITCVSWHDIHAEIRDRIAVGNVPDLINADNLSQYRQQNRLLDVRQWVSPETYEKIYPELHKRATIDGVVWGVTDYVTASALYYNADILEAAGADVPETWQELVSACQIIKSYDHDLIPWGLDMTTDEGYATFAYYIWNNGSDFTDAAGNWTLDVPQNREAVEFLINMRNTRLTNPDPTAQTRYECQKLFGQGKLAMMIAPSTLPKFLEADGCQVNYGVAPLPANGSNPSVSTAGGNYLMCFAKQDRTQQELTAITAFADAFYEDTAYSQWVQMEGFLPATTTANAILQAQDGNMTVWNQILGNLKFYPAHREEWGDVKEGAVHVLQYTIWEGNTWLLLDKFQKEISGK